MKKQKLVVIGNGMASIKTIEEVLSAKPDKYEITVFGNEPYGNYNRILLPALLSGDKTFDDIVTHSRQWYEDNGIKLYAGKEKSIVKIDRSYKRVFSQDGTSAYYDRLLIATGSNVIFPDIEGQDLDGVVSFRDANDTQTMIDYSKTHQQAIVLGGGLLGLEAASGLAQRGMKVTVLHSNAILLNRQLDQVAAQLLQNELEQRGITFELNSRLVKLIGDEKGHVQCAVLDNGRQLACDLLVSAIGIKPNIDIAKACGLYCERGIMVDDTMQSYDPSIYAVGECIQHRGSTFGLVAPVFEQAKVCANHLCKHGVAIYVNLPSATKLKVTGIHLFSMGNFLGNDESQVISLIDEGLGVYKKVIIEKDQLMGAILYGDTSQSGWYQSLLADKTNVQSFKEQLIFNHH